MTFEETLHRLLDSVSGGRTKGYVEELVRYHRIQASPGYDEAIDAVRDAVGRFGIDAPTSSFPADGATETYGWTAPIGWRIRDGGLRETAPTERTLCSFGESPISILGQSAGGRAAGELVHIGKGTTPEDIEGVELSGRFALACGRPTEVLKRIRDRGIAGLVLYPDSERTAASYDLVQYAGLFPKASELETTPMGFSISRREADRLVEELEKSPVRLEGEVDADSFEGSMRVLEAEIAGDDPQSGEVLLVAHLCHPRPSANDNASGSGLLIEMAGALSALSHVGELRNTVRCLWVPEFNGTIPWAAANAETLRLVRYVLNLDMVGQSPDRLGEPLRVFRAPNARPTFLNACFAPILERIAEDERAFSSRGSRRPLHWMLDRPSGGSDHLVFQAAPHALPAVMLGHDDPYWHTDLDTTDKVDPTRLKHVGLVTAAIATLPTWAPETPRLLGEWLFAFSGRALTQASALARRMEPATGRRLLAVSRRIEAARAVSLGRLIGEGGWDVEKHLELLEAVETTLADSAPHQEATTHSKPRRRLDGPVRFEIADRWSDEDRAFVEEKLSGNHRAVIESLVNLCDGTRDVDEIALHLTLDFGRPFSRADVERGVELLAEAEYLEA